MSNILKKINNSILFVGTEIELEQKTIDEILRLFLEDNITMIYLLSPSQKVIDYLEDIGLKYKKEFQIINKVSEILKICDYNIILSGFKPIEKDILKILKGHSRSVYYFGNLGVFHNTWKKNITNFIQIEYTLNDYIIKNSTNEIEFSNIPIIHKNINFENRGNEQKEVRTFIQSNVLRACIITGISGIGKKSLLNEIKRRTDLKNNCLEYYFKDREYAFVDLIMFFIKQFRIIVEDKNIPTYYNKNDKIFKQIFTNFDNIPNSNIIFYNTEIVTINKQINDTNLNLFLNDFINRNSFCGNKLFFISSTKIELENTTSDNCKFIRLGTLRPNHIQLILEFDFYKKGKKELAQKIMNYKYTQIQELVGGHPTVAKLLVEACEYSNIDTIYEDINFRKSFETKKIEYLLKIIKLSKDEKKILNLLSLIKEPFNLNLLSKIKYNISIFKSLMDKFLIEIIYNKNSENYYIPSIVKDVVLNDIKHSDFIVNNDILGKVYWEVASDSLDSQSIKTLNNYRLSLHHYEKAENQEKINQLILYFKPIFLQKAENLYIKQKYEKDYLGNEIKEAWNYFNIIYDNNISNLPPKSLNLFLVCNYKLNKTDTDNLFKQAIQLHKDNILFYITYINYLFDKERFIEAENIYNLNNNLKTDIIAKNLLIKTLCRTDRKIEASEIFKTKIHQYSGKNNDSEIQIIKDFISFIDGGLQEKIFKQSINEVTKSIKDNLFDKTKLHISLKKLYTEQEVIQLISRLESAISFMRKTHIYDTGINFQELTTSIIDCLIKMSKRIENRKPENIHNDSLSDCLENNYIIDGQSRIGNKLMDIEIKKQNGATISIIEGLILSGLNRNYIYEHIHKLLHEYDKTGNQINYIIVYAEKENITELWNKYILFLNELNDFDKRKPFNYKLINKKDRTKEINKDEIFFVETIHKRNSNISIYHIMIKMI